MTSRSDRDPAVFLVAVIAAGEADWFEVTAPTAADAVAAVHSRIFGGEPLGAGTAIEAQAWPDNWPVRITRLADMTEFEADFEADR